MATVIDTSVWVDFFRPATPAAVRHAAAEAILQADAALCEPVWFELLRHVPPRQQTPILAHVNSMPWLATPATLWREAMQLGQAARAAGLTTGSMDLLIAAVCLHHKATLVAFDRDYENLARISPLRLRLLPRG